MTDPTLPSAQRQSRKPYRSRWESVGWIAAVPIAILLLISVSTNRNFHWDIVWDYLAAAVILRGIWMTLLLTTVSIFFGVVFGAVLAIMLRSSSTFLSKLAFAYVWFFRGTPLLVQLIFWFNLAALYPTIGFPGFEVNATHVITPFFAAVVGLTSNEAAYMAEIIRGGFESVSLGQTEAASSLGLRPRHVTFRILLPQAMRLIVPIIGNQTIAMLKNSSLVSVLGVSELLHSAEIVYGSNSQTIPLLVVACAWYLAMSTVLTVIQHAVEHAYGRSTRRARVALSKPLEGAEEILLKVGNE